MCRQAHMSVYPGVYLAGLFAYNVNLFIPLAVSTPGARAPRREFGCPLFFVDR